MNSNVHVNDAMIPVIYCCGLEKSIKLILYAEMFLFDVSSWNVFML